MSDLAKQCLALKRFREKDGLGVEDLGLAESSVAGHIYNFHLRPDCG